jgi:hypothetical protein
MNAAGPPLCCRCRAAPAQHGRTYWLAYCGDACRAASMADYEAGAHRAAEAAACLGDWDPPVRPQPIPDALRARLRAWSPTARKASAA